MKRYERLPKLVSFIKPQSIIEIGTHKGARAKLICEEALRHNPTVRYIGYDLFEDATPETDKREMNGKGAGSSAVASAVLDDIKSRHPGFTYELVKGDTRKTLHGTEQRADFVFIDGGHSLETICGDYEAVQGSRLIVFDDYYTHAGKMVDDFGCNAVMTTVAHELMPEEDRGKGGVGIKLAVVGYSAKWEKAIERVVKQDNHKSVSLWRGGPVERADLVCAIDTLGSSQDVDADLDYIRKLTQKRFFFVIKADALRSLDTWRQKLDFYFHVTEWMPVGDEVVGTGLPLSVVGEWKSIGAGTDDQRFEQAKINCTLSPKRVRPYQDKDGNLLAHDRRAVLIAYGPSLQETWPGIMGEKRLASDEADIISMSASHDFLIRRGIVPDFHVECDPRPHKALNLMMPNEGVKYYIASCCHPDLTDKLKDFDLSFWHMMNGPESYRIIEDIESERGEPLVCGGGNVGLRAIALFYGLGYRKFTIYGMDASFAQAKDGAPLDANEESVKQWAGVHKGKPKNVIKVRCGEKWFLTSPVDVTYTRHFFDTVRHSEGAAFSLVGNGLLQEMTKQMGDEIQEQAA